MNIAGLDLSLTSTGYAAPDGTTHTIKPGRQTGVERLAVMTGTISQLIADAIIEDNDAPDLVMIEGYSYGSHGKVFEIGELGGCVKLQLYKLGVPFIIVAPSSLKKFATCKGNAQKDEVFAEAIRQLDYQGSSNDEADALWLREIGRYIYAEGKPLLASAALSKARNDVAVAYAMAAREALAA